MEYRTTANELLTTLHVWDEVIPVISKMFRGTEVDIQDCLTLLKNEKVNVAKLQERYKETAKYDNHETKVLQSLQMLLTKLKGKANGSQR